MEKPLELWHLLIQIQLPETVDHWGAWEDGSAGWGEDAPTHPPWAMPQRPPRVHGCQTSHATPCQNTVQSNLSYVTTTYRHIYFIGQLPNPLRSLYSALCTLDSCVKWPASKKSMKLLWHSSLTLISRTELLFYSKDMEEKVEFWESTKAFLIFICQILIVNGKCNNSSLGRLWLLQAQTPKT